MVTKNDMEKLMKSVALYLKTLGLSESEILGTVELMIKDAIVNGIYKNESSANNEVSN